jgi:hypothetical protein
VTGSEPTPYVDEFGDKWETKVAHFRVGLKLECPNGKELSFVTGTGGQNLVYQILATGHAALPWPPDPASTEYGERCGCDECVGRLVGDTVDAIRAEANAIQATMKSNEDTYTLRYLESARDVILREVQLMGYGIHRDIPSSTDTYVGSPRRVAVRYDDSFEEVKEATVTVLGSQTESHPGTLAGALAALRRRAARRVIDSALARC